MSMLKQYIERLAIKGEHILVFLGSAAGGAALGYLEAHMGDLPSALTDGSVAHHMEMGAAYAALVAVIALARKSFLLPATPPGGAS